MLRSLAVQALLGAALFSATIVPARAEDATEVLASKEIGANLGGFSGRCGFWDDGFGAAVAAAGKFDDDDVPDAFVGSPLNYDSGPFGGNLWLFFLNGDGSIKEQIEIGRDTPGLVGAILGDDHFGAAVANLGDLDGDGTTDIAVGAPGTDQGSLRDVGAVWILFLNDDGTVKDRRRIDASTPGLAFTPNALDRFGHSLATVADMSDDGVPELAVGEPGDDDGTVDSGAVWLIRLNADASVAGATKYSETSGNLPPGFIVKPAFGESLASPGDIDGNGTPDLAVGQTVADSSGGSVTILLLDENAAAVSASILASGVGGIPDVFPFEAAFGSALSAAGDRDADGVPDLFVGASGSSEVWAVFLDSSGGARGVRKLATPETAFDDDAFWRFTSFNFRRFGSALAVLGDVDGNGIEDVIAGDDRFLCPDYPATTTTTVVCASSTTTMTSTSTSTTTSTILFSSEHSPARISRAPRRRSSTGKRAKQILPPAVDGDQCLYIVNYNNCGDPKFRPSGGEAVQVLNMAGEPCAVGECSVDAACLPCGRPASKIAGAPVATDALVILSAAVGSTVCGNCLCDVDSDDAVTASDALAILLEAVGLPASETPICRKFD